MYFCNPIKKPFEVFVGVHSLSARLPRNKQAQLPACWQAGLEHLTHNQRLKKVVLRNINFPIRAHSLSARLPRNKQAQLVRAPDS